MRIKKIWKEGAEVKEITIYHYGEAGNVLQETDENGNLKATYIYANGQRICKIDADGNFFFYFNDPLSSPLLIMSEDGEVVHRYHFGPFGNIEAAKGTTENDYLFTGKELDRTGLYYFGTRYYKPEIGRFITPDPKPNELRLKDPQSLNPYVYCRNNPLILVDPDGETWAEVLYFSHHWGQYRTMTQIREECSRETYKLAKTENPTPSEFAKVKFHNDRYDAFRHALLAIKTIRILGEESARRILINHEIGSGLPKNDLQMDIFNNEMGMKAALNPVNKNIPDVKLARGLLDTDQLQMELFSEDKTPMRLSTQIESYIKTELKTEE